MRSIKITVILIALFLMTASCSEIEEIKVMTFNLRYDGGSSRINDWQSRKTWVSAYLDSIRPDVIGTQELLHHQLQDILTNCEYYKSVGGGRVDGVNLGEYSAILYNQHLIKLIDSDTFWLSEQPNKVGKKGWDAAYIRICTWACFESKNGNQFYVFNTHLDNESELARKNSAQLILDKIENIAQNHPVTLLGDFNANLSSATYGLVTNKGTLQDARALVNTDTLIQGSFNGFGYAKECNNRFLIDHIFVNEGFKVQTYKVDVQKKGERYISDHYPIVIDATIKK